MVFFGEVLFLFLLLELFDGFDHILTFSFLFLFFLEADKFSFLDLFDDFEMSFILLLFFFLFLLFIELDFFESFDFHHEVFSFFFYFFFFDNFFFFFNLHISDGDTFGIVNHFIHFLDIIELFIEKFLGS